MVSIILVGPRAIEAARAWKADLKHLGARAWDLSPDIPEAVRLDCPLEYTPTHAIASLGKWVEFGWLDGEGWSARPMTPVEDPDHDGVQGVEL